MTDDRAALDEPRARLLAALAEHPNATYVRVEVIDLRAALALPPDPERLAGHYHGWVDDCDHHLGRPGGPECAEFAAAAIAAWPSDD